MIDEDQGGMRLDEWILAGMTGAYGGESIFISSSSSFLPKLAKGRTTFSELVDAPTSTATPGHSVAIKYHRNGNISCGPNGFPAVLGLNS